MSKPARADRAMLDQLHRLAVQGLIERLKQPDASASDFATAVKLLIAEDVKAEQPPPSWTPGSEMPALPSFDEEEGPMPDAIESNPNN